MSLRPLQRAHVLTQLRAKSLSRTMTRLFLSIRQSSSHREPLELPPAGPPLLGKEPIDEECCPGYNSKKFYPAKPGEVLANRYQILVKVGWGVSSTVWFAHGMRGYRWEPENVVALNMDEEREIEEHFAAKNPSHRGHPFFRTSSGFFEIGGPKGRHICLAYEPMREPIWLFQRRFKNDIIPLPLVKTYILFLLTGLDYFHTDCRVVHTDLKLENTMVSIGDPAVLDDFMNTQIDQSVENRVDHAGRPVYRCCNDFGPLRNMKNIPQIVDFGTATRLDSENSHGIYPIQPDHHRAPEVILGCGWKISADIWNLGVLLWDLIQGKELFQRIYNAQGDYDAKAHLAEMIASLGPPPPELVARYNAMLSQKWPDPIKIEDGSICESSEKYLGGPLFGQDGIKSTFYRTEVRPR